MKQESIYVRPRSSRLILIILLTLLIHFLLLLVLIIPYTPLCINKELAQKLEQLHHKIHQQDPEQPWVTVNPQVSQGGAPVYLIDDDHDEDDTPDTTAKQTPPPDAATPPADTQQAIETDVVIPDNIQETAATDDTAPTIPIAQKQNRPYDPNYIPASLFKQPLAAHGKKKTMTAKPTGPKKQPLTMTQLVKDFDTHLHQEEHTTQTSSLSLSMIGQATNNAKLTERQLKEGRFMEKLASCIIAAWRVHAAECPLSAPQVVALHLELVIERSGALTTITILKSSGLRSVDQFITRIMESAGKSFPPLPAFLITNAYHIRCYLDGINPRQGPYRLVASQR